jgi:hypothetical protein
MEKSTVQVKVKTIQNVVYELEVAKDIDIGDFKSEIQKVSGMQKDEMRLIYRGKHLKDGESLDKFIKQDNETVHLIKGMRAGPPAEPNPQSAPTNQNIGGNPIPLINNPPNPPTAQAPPQQNVNAMFGGIFDQIFGNLQGVSAQIGQPRPPAQPAQQNPQQAQPQNVPAPDPAIVNAQVRADGLQSIDNRGMSVNFPRIEGQNVSEEFTTYTLNHTRLHESADYLGRITGPQARVGPEVPTLSGSRNSLGVLGSYLGLLNTQLEHLNPVLRRASDILERESMVQGQARQEFGNFSHNIGNALNSLSQGIDSVAPLLRDLRFMPESGRFGVVSAQNPPVDPAQAQPQAQPGQPGPQQPQVFNIPANQGAPAFNLQIHGNPQGLDGIINQFAGGPFAQFGEMINNARNQNQQGQGQAQAQAPGHEQPQGQAPVNLAEPEPQVPVEGERDEVVVEVEVNAMDGDDEDWEDVDANPPQGGGGIDLGAMMGALGGNGGQGGGLDLGAMMGALGGNGGQGGGLDLGAMMGALGGNGGQGGGLDLGAMMGALGGNGGQGGGLDIGAMMGALGGNGGQGGGLDIGAMMGALGGNGGIGGTGTGGNQHAPQQPQQPAPAPQPDAPRGPGTTPLAGLFGNLGLNRPAPAQQPAPQPDAPRGPGTTPLAGLFGSLGLARPAPPADPQNASNNAPAPNGMNNLLGNIMGIDINAPMSTVIRENNLMEDGQGEYDILGVCLSELNMTELSVLLTGDLTPLSFKHPQIKQKITDLFAQENNDIPTIKNKFAEDFNTSFLKITDDGQSGIELIPGFEPQQTVREVVDRNFDPIMNAINATYTPESEPQFGDAYAAAFKSYIGEMAFELSEGFENGLNGLQILIRKYNQEYILKVTNGNDSLASMADMMFGATVWNKVLQWTMEFKEKKECGDRVKLQEARAAKQLLVDEVLAKLDAERVLDSQVSGPEKELSENYKEGAFKGAGNILSL